MAMVPGYKHDIFLSYAQIEAAWVDAFRKALSQEFHERAGKAIAIWQDSQNVRMGQKWTAEIDQGISRAAAFLAVISPSYHQSTWCKEERRILLEHSGGLENLKVESFYRFLKIIKAPGPAKAHLSLLKELQHVRFFSEADEYELPPDSKEFTAMIRETVRTIRELLVLMANRQQGLYLAPVPPEMEGDRRDLQNQLADWGYNVKPDILLSPEFGTDAVREEMEGCSLAIFLLGGLYDRFVEDQIEVAQEMKKRLVFWISPGKAKTAEQGQSALISRIRETLPASSQILGGASIRGMIDQLQGALKQEEEPAVTPAADAGLAKVYLIYDSTLTTESQTANRLSDILREQNLEVLRSERDANHGQLMRASNGVLLLRAANTDPDNWLQSYVKDLRYANEMFEKEPDVKALLVSHPERIKQDLKNIDVVVYDEPFFPGRLNGFIGKLKTKAAHVSR